MIKEQQNEQCIDALLQGKRVRYCTLGCKLNFAETATLSDHLRTLGVKRVGRKEEADVCVINTCSVTDVADQKCRQQIRRLHRENPQALIVVMGCYAQLQTERIADIEGVDLVIGMEHKGEVVDFIKRGLAARESLDPMTSLHKAYSVATKDIRTFVPSCSRGNRTRYFIKVQDGCNYYCTYCTIPIARGRSRNGSIASLVEQAEDVAAKGGREIVITGVNIGDFGRTTGEKFVDLVRAFDTVEGISRYRISSLEPDLLTDDVLDYCAVSRAFMPHYHIPLQSGSDEVLRLMHRHYDTSLFREKVERIHTTMPDAFIGVDVIVGMRGETEELFEESYKFLESLDVTRLHVFMYSERPGTKALDIPHVVSPEEKKERSHRLLELSERKRKAFYRKYIGTEREVLWEHLRPGQPLRGFTDNYIRVELPNADASLANKLTRVCLGDFTADEEALTAKVLD